MSFDKSTLGALYAIRECLRDHYAAKLATRQTESQAKFGAGYILPTAPVTDSISLQCDGPASITQYPWIMVTYQDQSWTNTPTGATDATALTSAVIKWWFTHSGEGGGSKLSVPEVAAAVMHDIRNVVVRTLRDTTTGVMAAYAGGAVTNITPLPTALPVPMLTSNSGGLYSIVGSICLQAHQAVVAV